MSTAPDPGRLPDPPAHVLAGDLATRTVERDQARAEVRRLRALVGDVEDQPGWGRCSRAEVIRQADEFHANQLHWLDEHDKRRDERDEARVLSAARGDELLRTLERLSEWRRRALAAEERASVVGVGRAEAQAAAVEALADECDSLARRLLADDEPSGAAFAVAETLEATAGKIRAALAVGDGAPAEPTRCDDPLCGPEPHEHHGDVVRTVEPWDGLSLDRLAHTIAAATIEEAWDGAIAVGLDQTGQVVELNVTLARPRLFALERTEDISGVSGTGTVAYGVAFPDGRVATRWNGAIAQTCVWDSIADVAAIHGHGGATKVRWLDEDGA